ncbi:MAG: DNA replication/repair protein RecF [Clostridia bacterium]|nr:DNA replication/repair protein RecF [Clostridia bacterium]
MRICNLKTENYRNLTDNPPKFCDGLNILYGSNAAGKTNTLEAIYLFAAGKSFRTKSDKDFITHGKDFAHVEICYDTQSMKGKSMAINFLQSGQNVLKSMLVESNAVDKASEFLGNFRAVLFTPDHLELVKGAPEERRRLVDMALCQIKPRFVKALNEYGKILAQRNNYLKSMKIRSQKADLEYLDVLNRLLAQAGGIIVKQRGLYCENLDRFATEAYGNITSDSERLFVNYISRAKIGNLSDEEECTDALYSLYKASTHKDVETGRTSVGPHRDELMIYIAKSADKRKILQSINSEYEKSEESADGNMSGFAARTFGSQGQQRSAVLAIKLAEGEIAKERCGEYPVFLLDDLFSELDSARRERLCRMLEQRQCIITACDKASFPIMNSVNIINVCGGKYKAE